MRLSLTRSASRLSISALALLAPLAAQADVVINEIMYHPDSENVAEEYIEIYNNGAAAVDVSGWAFTSGVDFTIPAATPAIAPGGYLVVTANPAVFAAKYPSVTNYVASAGWVGQLSNSGNNVTLRNAAGTKVDEVNYADDGDWAERRRDAVADVGFRGWEWHSDADGFGKSLELINATYNNSYGQNWGASTTAQGTPGAANSIASANIAPVIREVAHSPLVPKSTDTVTVIATIQDDLATAITATLFYKADTAGTWSSGPMFDDGAHGDGLAGDGVFGASIGAQSNGTIMEFYVHAEDSAANARTWPRIAQQYDTGTSTYSPAQIINALYQVDDTVYAGAMPIYRAILKAADQTTLATINTSGSVTASSHAKYNATWITVDGTSTELRYLCSLRNRGHGSGVRQPQSYNISIPKDFDWKGRTGLNLNTYYTYLQLLGSAFMRQVGLPSAETRQVQFRVNGVDKTQVIGGTNSGSGNDFGRSYGFYVAVEDPNSEFAAHHFPNDDGGNIYTVRRSDTTSQEGDFALLTPGVGENAGDPYRPVYFKQTNTSEDNWSDLIATNTALAKATYPGGGLIPTYAGDYVASINASIDVAEWMRWFASFTLMASGETSIYNGYGDDFNLYFGVTDTRARLLAHDLDTIFGHGDAPNSATTSIFKWLTFHNNGTDPTPLNGLFRHPQFAPIFYQELLNIIDNSVTTAKFDALTDLTLGGVVNATLIQTRKDYYTQRVAWLRTQIPVALGTLTARTTGGTALTITNGYPVTTSASCILTGTSHAAKTRSVKINGVDATWDAFTASFASATVTLTPGINRLLVQSFDANNAEFERAYVDVQYDDGGTATVTGTLAANTTWTAAGGPYRVSADLTIPTGVTLTIEPGTSIYIGSGSATVDLFVNSGGRILAEGTENQPIRFLKAPGATYTWAGIDVNGAVGSPLSVFRHCTFADSGSYAIDVNAGDVEIDNCIFNPNCADYLSLDGASFLVSNCVFPTPNAAGEVVHGTGGVRSDGRGIVRDCFFGYITGYNDVFDFTGGNRNSPILQFINNVCVGGDDDILDLDGTDAWIEGNILMNTHRIGTPDSASAVSGGNDSGNVSNITVIGNLIYNVDQACTGKQGNFYTFLNNTVVDQNGRNSDETEDYHTTNDPQFLVGVLNFADDGTTYGLGMYAEGNIIHSCERLVRNYIPANSTVTWNNNIFPPGITWTGPGSGNTSTDALLAGVFPQGTTYNIPTPTAANYRYLAPQIRAQFALDPCSPGKGTGPNGTDKGGARLLGVSLSGAPTGTTNTTSATVVVGTLMTGSGIPSTAGTFPAGSGWTHYQHRLNGGAWSAETPIATPITLTGLTDGIQTLEVIGKNDAGFYQNDTAFGTTGRISTATWTVDSAYVPPAAAAIVRINEVLSSNTETINFGTQFPDIIELYNAGNATANLAGWGITDNPALPYKYAIPNGTTLAPGAYLTIYAASNAAVPNPKTGFSIRQSGDDLTLTRSVAQGGGIVDSVVWGQQISDYSISRCADGSWALGTPTFGSANRPVATANLFDVKINEWLSDAVTLFANDFIELYNPSVLPASIGGCYLTDNPWGDPTRSPIAALTFIQAGGYLTFKADGDTTQGPDHVDFRLSPLQGEIGFLSSTLALIDTVVYGPQRTDSSEGRSPNGTAAFARFTQPTPGAPNPGFSGTISTTTTNLIPANQTWKYYQHATAGPANDVNGRDYNHPLYDDTAWLTGQGILYIESAAVPTNTDGFAKNTLLTGFTATRPYQTYYFRTTFTYNGSLTNVALNAKWASDDGAVIYLNGVEIKKTDGSRIRMNTGTPTFATLANATAPEDNGAGTIILETGILENAPLINGTNVISVSVHQNSAQSAGAGSSDITWGLKLDAVESTTVGSNPIILNEVLALNTTLPNPDTSLADWIELYNNSNAAVSLEDYSLTDEIGNPRKFVFPAGASVPAFGYYVVQCASGAATATNTGFALSATADQVYLFKPIAQNGGLQDSVVFGQQVANFAVGRIPDATGAFALTVPTRGAINSAAGTDPLSAIKLNEWVTNPAVGQPTWFELYNTGTLPVSLAGNYLTDVLTNKTKALVPPLTFLSGTGTARWLQIIADNDASATPNHVNFTLDPGEGLGLFNATGTAIDAVATSAQTIGRSQGRFADGTSTIIVLLPTPGAANQEPTNDTDSDGIPDAWEILYGLDINNAADASLDTDGDGMTNLQEYLSGTNPLQDGDRLSATAIPSGANVAIRFTAKAGKAYTVQYKNNLTDVTWTNLAQVPAAGADTVTDVTDTGANAQTQRFYRVITPQQ